MQLRTGEQLVETGVTICSAKFLHLQDHAYSPSPYCFKCHPINNVIIYSRDILLVVYVESASHRYYLNSNKVNGSILLCLFYKIKHPPLKK